MSSPIVIDPKVLTDRRREVLLLVLDGLSNKAIAKKLFLTEETVKTHVRVLFGIFKVHNRAELLALCYRSGFAPCGRCRRAKEEGRHAS